MGKRTNLFQVNETLTKNTYQKRSKYGFRKTTNEMLELALSFNFDIKENN